MRRSIFPFTAGLLVLVLATQTDAQIRLRKPSLPKPPAPSIPKPKVPSIPKPKVPSIPKPKVPSTPKVPSLPKPRVPSAPKPKVPSLPKPRVPSLPDKPPVVRPNWPKPRVPSLPDRPPVVRPNWPKPRVPSLPPIVGPTGPKPPIVKPPIVKPTIVKPTIVKPTIVKPTIVKPPIVWPPTPGPQPPIGGPWPPLPGPQTPIPGPWPPRPTGPQPPNFPTSGAGQLAGRFPIYGQPDGISCGPTCLAMVLKYYGQNAGIGPLKTKARTRLYKSGNTEIGLTLPAGMAKALLDYGVPATIQRGSLADVTRLIDQNRPPILLVRSGEQTWHWIVATGYRNGASRLQIADPGSGGSSYELSGRNLEIGWTYQGSYYDGSRVRGQELNPLATKRNPFPQPIRLPSVRRDLLGDFVGSVAPTYTMVVPVHSPSGGLARRY